MKNIRDTVSGRAFPVALNVGNRNEGLQHLKPVSQNRFIAYIQKEYSYIKYTLGGVKERFDYLKE